MIRRLCLIGFYLLALFLGSFIIESDIIMGHHTNISYISRTALWADKPKEPVEGKDDWGTTE